MPSLQMTVTGLLLQALRKPEWATYQRAERTLHTRKEDVPPPAAMRHDCDVYAHGAGGFHFYEVMPKHSAVQDRAVLFLHGGAFAHGIKSQHWALIHELAKANCRVLVPIYGLAPKHTYRDTYPLLETTYATLLRRHNPGNITFVGDSSGGGLALSFAQTLLRGERPGRLVLISPWVDLTASSPEINDLQRVDPWLSRPGLEVAAKAWAGGDDLHDPRLSPLLGDFHGLPPMDVFLGTRDILYPEGRRLVDKARNAGVEVTVNEVEGAVHVFPLLGWTPEGRNAQTRISDIAAGHGIGRSLV